MARLETSGRSSREHARGVDVLDVGRSRRFLALFALTLLLALVSVLILCGEALAAPSYFISRLTYDNLNDQQPEISNGRIAWQGASSICTWTSTAGIVTLPFGIEPKVSDDRVVWAGRDADGASQVYMWTPASGTQQMTFGTWAETPQISGDRIVWCGSYGAQYELITWTPALGAVPITSGSITFPANPNPQVSGDRVVWTQFDGAYYQVFTWTPTDGITQVTNDSHNHIGFRVDGNRIVWMTELGGKYDIYTWTPTEPATRLTTDAQTGYSVRVSGNRVVWDDRLDIYTWTPSGGTVRLDTGYQENNAPDVEGDTVVWAGRVDATTFGHDYDIYVWSAGTAQIVHFGSGPNGDGGPRISGSRIVWEVPPDGAGHPYEIYTATAMPVIAGTVEGNSGGATVPLGGARVTVTLDPADSQYDTGNAANNLVGSGTTNSQGQYIVDATHFRGGDLPLGRRVKVTASMAGYVNVTQTGSYDHTCVRCDFRDFASLFGAPWQDRRLPAQGSPVTFQYLLPNYLGQPPLVTSASPASGPTAGGTSVAIRGSEFSALYGADAVTFGGINATTYTVVSSTEIAAVAPAHAAGTVKVSVRAAGGTATSDYTYVAPTVTSVSPTSGRGDGGVTVSIRGTGFNSVAGTSAVSFGGTSAAGYTIDSDTQISALTPPHAPGTVDVIVADSLPNSNGRFTYLALPTITSINPSSGSAAGGGYTIIAGTGFTGLSGPDAVTFGGVNANYSVNSSTQLHVDVPAHPVGTVRVKVTAAGGVSADTPAAQYTYTQPRPTITSMSPSCGPISGGTSVVITGNYFTGLSGAAAVKFGDLNAASYTVDSATQITAVSPAHALGAVRLTVTTPAGTTADTTDDDFVYLPTYGTTEQFVPDRITNNSYEDGVWQVSGDRVVFGAASDPTDYENGQVYTWTPSEGAVLLSTTSHENQRARVYGDRVVWYGYVGSDLGNGEIFTWTPTTGLVQITKNSGDDQTPEVYGDRVVWAGWDSNRIYQIYTWTPSGGTKMISSETSNPAYPVVSGDRISWCGDGTRVVKTWTAASGIVNVSELEDAGYKYGLKTSGDRLVWTSDNGVFTWTPAGGIVRITPDAADAQVFGDRVAWSIWSGLNFQVFTWTPTGGIIQLSAGSEGGVAPQISGDFVVWVAYPASGAVIRGWTPDGGIIEIAASQCVPFVSGDRVAWTAGEFADSDVYTAIVRPIISAAVSGNTPANGPTTGGTTVVITGSGFSALSGSSALSRSAGAPGVLAASVASAVSFGDEAALSYTVDSDNQITAVAPPHTAGKVDVYVETSAGASATAGSGNDYTYVPASLTRIENTDSHIRYSGSWALSTTPTGAYSGGSCSYSQSTGATVTVSFSGTTLNWIATRDDTGRSATVSVDGGAPMTVSLYSLAPQYQARVWTTGWLPSGTHVVTITRVTGALNVDAFDTSGTFGTPVSYGRVEQTDPHITYSAVGWAPYPAPPATGPASGGNYARSSTSGASATVWFTGTKIAWIGMKGTTPGIVDVYLDDVWKAKLDLVASSATYQLPLWTSAPLPNTLHHLDLVRNKDSLSTEFIVLDALDIWGTIQTAPPAITSLSPASGLPAGGTSVTIGGTSLSGATSVTFGGTPVVFTVNSSTKITATAPAHAVGPVPVQVTTSAGTASSTFTYAVALPTTRLDVVKTTTVTTPGTIWGGTWAPYTSASAYKGTYMRSSTAGAYVLIAFKGTRLDWITMKGTTGGIADIYLDGSSTKAASINLYVSSPIYQRNLWSTGPLADGYHTVKIVRAPGSVSGRYLTIDAVEVAGTLLAPTRIEEKASPSPFTWNPAFTSWTTGTITSASGGTYKYINTPGAYVSFRFTGVGFQIIARTAPSYGNLTVTVDGVSQTVSLYSSVTTYKKIVFTKFTKPGTHTVKISRAGTKSTSSTGYTIDLDAIDLYGVPG